MRISDWSSDVCSSDLDADAADQQADSRNRAQQGRQYLRGSGQGFTDLFGVENVEIVLFASGDVPTLSQQLFNRVLHGRCVVIVIHRDHDGIDVLIALETELDGLDRIRSAEDTSEIQSLMRISYAVFCLKKKKNRH